MTNNASKLSREKPLLGAVLCCTSISPEDRTQLAEYAQSMGAEHKLDLTSDVTHLIVGATNTPKYAYVAREREDVKVLRPEWVEAVRERWMGDENFNMNALEAQYRVPIFAGLKICITGFDDLEFRAQLAKNVNDNGGEYTGDLTKDVTHLVAFTPEGKKYEYATAWGKKIVSIKWYQDTLRRGMQLDELTYHPSVPPDEQGAGAWNRSTRQQSVLEKRAREDQPPQEPTRKMRRTASVKFGSQAEDVWADIVGGAPAKRSAGHERDVFRPSKSMSSMRRSDGDSKTDQSNSVVHTTKTPQSGMLVDAYLSGKYFSIEGFDRRKKDILSSTLGHAGSEVIGSTAELIIGDGVDSNNAFVVVPYKTNQSALPYFGKSPVKPTIVTEFWVEKCLTEKAYIPIQDYPLGGVIEEVLAPDVKQFVLNATGFQPIEARHISKAVVLAGAQYDESFSDKVSVLVMKSSTANPTKVLYAKQWKIPVVSEKWLWLFLKTGKIPSFTNYSPRASGGNNADDDDDDDLQQALDRKRRKQKVIPPKPRDLADPGDGFVVESKQKTTDTQRKPQGLDGGDDGEIKQHHAQSKLRERSQDDNSHEAMVRRSVQRSTSSKHSSQDGVLQEVSANPSIKSVPQKPKDRPHLLAVDSIDELKENALNNGGKQLSPAEDITHHPKSPTKRNRDATSMNSAIQDLLNMKAKAKAVAQSANTEDQNRGKKKKLLGRALSNLSNSSRTSNPRQSRASSIDSLNTDGVGSELAMPSANTKTNTRSLSDDRTSMTKPRLNSFTLKGRAQPHLQQQPSNLGAASISTPTIDPSDPNLCRDEYMEPEPLPQLTQLGYEESEEAIALRERLAERRRARTRLGQDLDDPEPELISTITPKGRGKGRRKGEEKRVLKDDEVEVAIGSAGWGGGRRTRGFEKKMKEVEDEGFVLL